jgi:hypothetical protein
VVHIGRVRPGARLELITGAGEQIRWEEFESNQVRLVEGWLNEPGFEGNWCLARLADLPGIEAASARVGFGSRRLVPAGRLRTGGLASQRPTLAHADGWVYIAEGASVRVVDWRDPARPDERDGIKLSDAASLAIRGRELAVSTGSDVLVFDLAEPASPRLKRSVKAGAEIQALTWLPSGFAAATARGIFTESKELRLDAAPSALAVVGSKLIVGGEGGVALLSGRHVGELEVTAADGKLSKPEALQAVGDRVHLVRAGVTHVLSTRKALRKVGERTLMPWWEGFVSDGSGALFKAEEGGVVRWQQVVRRLDRGRFEEAFVLRYAPERR